MKHKIQNLMIYERAQKEGKYIIEKNATVRQAAKQLNISKSTIHKDVTHVLESYHDPLALEVRKVLDKNFSERHIRGGEATKQKHLKLH